MPILARSGFLGRLEEACTAEARLVKPIPPGQLLGSIRPYLPREPWPSCTQSSSYPLLEAGNPREAVRSVTPEERANVVKNFGAGV